MWRTRAALLLGCAASDVPTLHHATPADALGLEIRIWSVAFLCVERAVES